NHPTHLELQSTDQRAEACAAEVASVLLRLSESLWRGERSAGRLRVYGMENTDADAEVRLCGGSNGECRKHRGVLADVVELDRLHGAGRIEVGALLVRSDALIDREQERGASGRDERVSTR